MNINQDTILVVKNNGSKQEFDAEKITQHVLFACEGLKVSASDLIMNARLKITNGIKSKDIQNALIQAANEMISEQEPDYELVAGRLLIQQIRKEVYNQYEHLPFYDEVKKRVEQGFYDLNLINIYNKEDFDYFESKIRYQDDDKLEYSAVKQMYSKYLIKHKDKCIETIQEVFMLIPMAVFSNLKDIKRRNQLIIKTYKLLNQRKIAFPTPVMNGARTNFKRFISCNLIDTGDSTKALALATARIMQCTASKSGIGLNVSKIRGLGADIGKPERVKHTGILPLMKTFEAATAALTQQSRGGSLNANIPFFHYEAELFAQLGDTKGTVENRTRFIDQTIIINNWFLEKALNKEDIYLFHMNHARELYKVLGYKDKFNEVYEKLVKTVKARHKKKINAFELLNLFLYERSITGRLYFVFADNAAKGPFKEPVYSTNLCTEILVPHKPLDGIEGRPEIGACILANMNLGYADLDDIPEIAEVLVNFLDYMIDYSDYVIPEVEYAAKNRRTLGVGISNLFGAFAKNKMFYNSKEAREYLHDIMESYSYNLILESCKLAKELGPCKFYKETKYGENWFPFTEYINNKETKFKLKQNWEALNNMLEVYGIRNSTLLAVPPAGNSAMVSNSTSGVEPPRELVTVKTDKHSTIKKLPPFFKTSKNYYTTAWGSDFNNKDYFKLLGIVQKFTDQAISTNQYSNALKEPDKKLKLPNIIEELLIANKYGLKTLYYQNFLSVDNEDGLNEKEAGCDSGSCSV